MSAEVQSLCSVCDQGLARAHDGSVGLAPRHRIMERDRIFCIEDLSLHLLVQVKIPLHACVIREQKQNRLECCEEGRLLRVSLQPSTQSKMDLRGFFFFFSHEVFAQRPGISVVVHRRTNLTTGTVQGICVFCCCGFSCILFPFFLKLQLFLCINYLYENKNVESFPKM